MRVTIASDTETRARLKQLAVIRGQTMEVALRSVVEKALKEARAAERRREIEELQAELSLLNGR